MNPLTQAPLRVRNEIDLLLATAKNEPDASLAWGCLEDAHVLSQPWVRPHHRVHLAMLALGWRTQDRTEVIGQVSRLLLAGPGSALGRYPAGNTGRANVSAFRPLPIRDDLAHLLNNDTAESRSNDE